VTGISVTGTLEKQLARKAFVRNVEELEVFKLAYALSLAVHKSSLGFPKIEQYDLASQMRRASKSICANLAEGFAKQSDSRPEFKRFVSLALGSSGEMQVWLKYCLDLGYIPESSFQEWNQAYRSVSKMLHKLKNIS